MKRTGLSHLEYLRRRKNTEMHGQPLKQVCRLIKESGIKAPKGTKRDQEKEVFREKYRAEHGKNPTSKELGRNTRITGQKNLVNYRSVWKQFAEHLRERGIKDIEKATSRQVDKFLMAKIEQGVTHKTYEGFCSALRKFEYALNLYAEKEGTGKPYDFEAGIERTREAANLQLEKDIKARAYQNPQAVVDAIKNPAHQVAAAIMLEGGARINEASLIDQKRLRGLRGDIGVIKLEGADAKGGKQRDLFLSKKTYQRIEKIVQEHGKFQVSKSDRQALRESIREAAEATGQKYTGAHGLRHNFAQNRVAELQAEGKSYGDALAETSRELGHERPSITLHYLRT